jgi:hypothetical protein
MRKKFEKATEGDVIISTIFPGWGVLIGTLALIKGERKRGFTMIGLGVLCFVLFGVLALFTEGYKNVPSAPFGITIFLLLGYGTICLGRKGFSQQGLPFTEERWITGIPAKIIGAICIFIGLIFAFGAFVTVWSLITG